MESRQTFCLKNQELRSTKLKRFLFAWISSGLCKAYPSKFKAPVKFYWIFQLSPVVCEKWRKYLSFSRSEISSWPRNWSTLENIWDFTTLGSHILRRGGILCPLSGGDCLFQLFLAISNTHKAFLRWSSFRTWVLMTFNERLAHGFALLMKNNTVPRKANEILTLTGSLLSWNIGIPSSWNQHWIRCRTGVM